MSSVPLSRSFKYIPFPSASGIKARYTPLNNTPTVFDLRFIMDRSCPKRDAVLDKYVRITPDTLRWSIITSISSKAVPQAVRRNRLKRRWAGAFAEALRKHGYHHNGRMLSGPKDGKNYVPGLKGCLEILVYLEWGLNRPHAELVGSCGGLVKSLEKVARNIGVRNDAMLQERGRREAAPESAGPGGVASSAWTLWRKSAA